MCFLEGAREVGYLWRTASSVVYAITWCHLAKRNRVRAFVQALLHRCCMRLCAFVCVFVRALTTVSASNKSPLGASAPHQLRTDKKKNKKKKSISAELLQPNLVVPVQKAFSSSKLQSRSLQNHRAGTISYCSVSCSVVSVSFLKATGVIRGNRGNACEFHSLN